MDVQLFRSDISAALELVFCDTNECDRGCLRTDDNRVHPLATILADQRPAVDPSINGKMQLSHFAPQVE